MSTANGVEPAPLADRTFLITYRFHCPVCERLGNAQLILTREALESAAEGTMRSVLMRLTDEADLHMTLCDHKGER